MENPGLADGADCLPGGRHETLAAVNERPSPRRPLAMRLFALRPPAAHAALDWLKVLGALVSVLGALWQRLLFDVVLGLPPPPLALLFWLVLGSFLAAHAYRGDPAERGAALLVFLAAAQHLLAVGPPTLGPSPEVEQYRFGLAGFLSSTWHGLPVHALVAATGVLAWAWLSAQSIRLRPLGSIAGAAILAFGATTVLGYATGSPWPFGV